MTDDEDGRQVMTIWQLSPNIVPLDSKTRKIPDIIGKQVYAVRVM